MYIEFPDMTKINDANSFDQTRRSAEFELEKKSVAALINNGYNTGTPVVVWQHPMHDDLREFLESNNYRVEEFKGCAVPGFLWGIHLKYDS